MLRTKRRCFKVTLKVKMRSELSTHSNQFIRERLNRNTDYFKNRQSNSANKVVVFEINQFKFNQLFSCQYCALKTKLFYLEKRLVRNAVIKFIVIIHLAQGSQFKGGILLLRSACHEQTNPSAPGNGCGCMLCLSSASRRYFKMNAKVSICGLLRIVLIIQLKKGRQQLFRPGWDRMESLHYSMNDPMLTRAPTA